MASVVEERANGDSLAETAYLVIRCAILWCELAPAERVTEAQLAARFGLGRAAVRAALTRLAHERLVTAIPRHGYAIAPITFQHVQDLFGVRTIIEPAAAQLAARHITPAQIAELERLNLDYAAVQREEDPVKLRLANTAFHVALARASGNARLAKLVEVTMEELNRVLYLPSLLDVQVRTVASVPEHERIIAAIQARDGAAAEAAAVEHIAPNRQFVIDALISSPRLRSLNLIES